jgi:molybdopterin synthase sulfur carrier subunit
MRAGAKSRARRSLLEVWPGPIARGGRLSCGIREGFMRVRVKMFATLGRSVGGKAPGDRFPVEIPEGSTIADLIQRLDLPQGEVKVTFVNARIRPLDWMLQPGDEVGIFPPIGGG